MCFDHFPNSVENFYWLFGAIVITGFDLECPENNGRYQNTQALLNKYISFLLDNFHIEAFIIMMVISLTNRNLKFVNQ